MFEAGDRVECINDDWTNFFGIVRPAPDDLPKLGSRWTVSDVLSVRFAVPAVVAGAATIQFVDCIFIALAEHRADLRLWSEHFRRIEGGDGEMDKLTKLLTQPLPMPAPETVDA